MKRNLPLILLLALLACISGFLLSKGSWLGRVGMGIFYKDYTFLNIWWQGAAVMFILFLLLLIIHSVLQRTLSLAVARISHIIGFMVALAGLYLTYHDFRNDLSHRLMGERFHIGFYLFWLGWMIISISFLFRKKKAIEVSRRDEADQ